MECPSNATPDKVILSPYVEVPMKRALLFGVFGAALLLVAGAAVSPLGSWLSAQPGQPLGAPDIVAQLSYRFEAIAARVLPAVVSVEAVKPPKLTVPAPLILLALSSVVVDMKRISP